MVLLFLCATCGAETHCPWLNEATAAGILNGPVTLEMKKSAETGEVCTFQYLRGTATWSLQIVVRDSGHSREGAKRYESHCISSLVPLRGIGNEAASCAIDTRNYRGEQVIGRVRDLLFIVGIRAGRGHTPPVKSEILREKAESVSESVAGNLF